MDITSYVSSDDVISQLRLFYGYPECNNIDFNKYLGNIRKDTDGYLWITVRHQSFKIHPVLGIILDYKEAERV